VGGIKYTVVTKESDKGEG